MLFDLIEIGNIRRCAEYMLTILVTITLQNMLLSNVSILGVRLFFIPALIAAIGLFEGGVWGGLLGLFTGFLCDMSLSGNTVILMATLTLIGFGSGLLSHFYVNRKFFSFLFICAAALMITAIGQMLRLLVVDSAGFIELLQVAVRQALLSLPFGLALYFPCRAIAKKGHSHE